MKKGTFYITTPLYYVNDIAHIGHVFEVIGIDVQARFRRQTGHDVFFLSGTDEHGAKIQTEAEQRGIPPQELIDRVADAFIDLWKDLHISNDDFLRTTQKRHEKGVTKLFKRLMEKDYFYKGNYEGWYCLPCETFWTKSQLGKNNRCPECNRETTLQKEETYFFKLSEFQKPLLNLFEKNKTFVVPEIRRNEMLNSFLKPGLSDLCVSRTSITWGIPLPGDSAHVIYVWFDALINYLTGVGFGTDEDLFRKWWPADIHVVGKDILKFHTLIWPAMLLAGDIEPPKQVYGHGFVNIKEEKMSKSKGNIIDPRDYIKKVSAEALRYFLMREISYGGDGVFSEENLVQRYNSDLANDLGNLVHRSCTMIEKYRKGKIPQSETTGEEEKKITTTVEETFALVEAQTPFFEYNRALAKIWGMVNTLNKYVNIREPWALAKDDAKKNELDTTLYYLAEGLRCVGSLIYPYMPEIASTIWQRIGMDRDILEVEWDDQKRWGLLPSGVTVTKGAPLFPRMEQ